VRYRFAPPTSLKQPEDVLLGEKYGIPLKTIQSLFQEGYKLYYRKMVAQLRINREICIFHNFINYFVHPLYVRMYVCMCVLFSTLAALHLCEPYGCVVGGWFFLWLLRFVYENVFCCPISTVAWCNVSNYKLLLLKYVLT